MSFFDEAMEIKDKLIAHRRHIHKHAEIGMNLPQTVRYIKEQLEKIGYTPEICEGGVIAVLHGKKPGKAVLLRADMDALPIKEESNYDFKSITGNMHACGHDFHSAMLLGAAEILKKHTDEICGQIKFMFQPGEETLEGAKAMIEQGVLENPKIESAMTLHVLPGVEIPSGSVIFFDNSEFFASVDRFKVTVNGTGCHGAMPNRGIDPLNVLSHIYISLQTIIAREIEPIEPAVLTIGEMHGGSAANIIPDSAYLLGTIRTFNQKTRDFIKKRLNDIVQLTAQAFRATANVTFEVGCPPVKTNKNLRDLTKTLAIDSLGHERVLNDSIFTSESKGMPSEDFSLIAEKIPGLYVLIAAGAPSEGYKYPLHHPKVKFDEEILPIGATLYSILYKTLGLCPNIPPTF